MNLPAQFIDQLLDTGQPLQCHRRKAARGTDRLESQRQRGDGLSELVVEIAGQPPPFILFGGGESTLQDSPGGLGLALLGHVADDPEQGVVHGSLSRQSPVRPSIRDLPNSSAAPDEAQFKSIRGRSRPEDPQGVVEAPPFPLHAEERERLAGEELFGAVEQDGRGVVGLPDQAVRSR